MGADGGSLPVRSEQIKKKQQEARTDPLQRARMRLSLCALSSRPLDKSTENIACDMHGNLFSLEEVLSSLLDAEKKKSLKSVFGIKRMKVRRPIYLILLRIPFNFSINLKSFLFVLEEALLHNLRLRKRYLTSNFCSGLDGAQSYYQPRISFNL